MKIYRFIQKHTRSIFAILIVTVFASLNLAGPWRVLAEMTWDDVNSVVKNRAYYRRQCGSGGASASSSTPATGNAYVLGDSISYGLHLTGIEQKLKEKLGGEVKVNYDGGRSITGPGSQAGVSPHVNALDAADTDQEFIRKAGVVIVVLGTNTTDDPFEENLKKLMIKLKGFAPNAKFYWVDIGANSAAQAQTWSARNKIIYENAKQDYTVISRYRAIFGQDKDPFNINSSLPFPGGGDQIHGAYPQLVDAIINAMGTGVTFEDLNRYPSLSLANATRAPAKNPFSRLREKLVNIASPTVSAQAAPTTPTSGQETVTLRDKIAQMLIVRVDTETNATEAVKYNVGGVYVREEAPPDHPSSYLNGEKLRAMEGNFKTPPIISTDGEGGQIDALGKSKLATPLPSAKELGTKSDEEITKLLATEYVRRMNELGITMNFAPVLDLDNPDSSIIGGLQRAFSNDPAVVTAKAQAFARGLDVNGIIPVYKHFPGHGNASGDSHQGKVTTPPLDQLKANDLKPYETIAPTAKAIMMGHLNVPGLGDENLPASINPEAIKLLRTDYKFNGVVMTDDLTDMKAITDLGLSQEQALEKAILAGEDMMLTNNNIDLEKIITYLEKQSATNPELLKRIDESSARILKLKGGLITPQTIVENCSCSSGLSTASNLQGSENAEKIFNFFASKYPGKPWIGAGFMGNMLSESGLNPRALEPGTTGDAPIRGRGYGLVQWTFEERQKPLEEQAAAKGLPVYDLGLQLDYVIWELENKYKGILDELQAITEGPDAVERATRIVEDKYEVHAGGPQPKRVADAKAFFLKYASNAVSSSASTSSTSGCTSSSSGQVVGGFALPLDKKWYDQHPGWFSKPHHDYPAADIPVPEKTPIYSMTAGRVVKAPNGGGYGTGVTIDVGNGITIIYGHGIDGGAIDGAKEGDTVKAGQLIMNSGNTGQSTGPHLHLEIVINGKRHCPQNLFKGIVEGNIPDINQLPTSGCSY